MTDQKCGRTTRTELRRHRKTVAESYRARAPLTTAAIHCLRLHRLASTNRPTTTMGGVLSDTVSMMMCSMMVLVFERVGPLLLATRTSGIRTSWGSFASRSRANRTGLGAVCGRVVSRRISTSIRGTIFFEFLTQTQTTDIIFKNFKFHIFSLTYHITDFLF